MRSNNKEKADTMLRIIGVGDKLLTLENKYNELYNSRLEIGRIKERKEKFAEEQPYYPDAPKELVSASELITQQQEILARNGENQRKREQVDKFETALSLKNSEIDNLKIQIENLQKQYLARISEKEAIVSDLEIARKSALDLHDESTAELEANITNIDMINVKVRKNLDKEKAEEDAKDFANQYASLTAELAQVNKEKTDLLQNANLPLPGLSVQDGELTYNGQKWDCMSGAEQLQVSTAIVRKLNPNCGFVLLDELEKMDLDSLAEFGKWLEAEGLQAIATRVSTGDECSIIIEDGYVAGQEVQEEPQTKPWEEGKF
jgi:hypothetical protein